MQVGATYEQAMARKYPEPIAVAVVKDMRGKPNPITLGWVMNTSIDPPMLAISIGRKRYSLEAIRQARAFVVSFPSTSMTDDMLFFGTKSGRDLDKLAARGTKTQSAQKVDGVLLADAVANFECKLEAELQTGDHFILVGRVVASHMNPDPSVRRVYSLGNEQFGGVEQSRA